MTEETNTQNSPQEDGSEELKQRVVAALKTVYDPEIPVDIYELGLIYDIVVRPTNDVEIKMTLTSPNCPVAESLPVDVEQRVSAVQDVASAMVEITWDPPWSPDMMSEAAKLELNL